LNNRRQYTLHSVLRMRC